MHKHQNLIRYICLISTVQCTENEAHLYTQSSLISLITYFVYYSIIPEFCMYLIVVYIYIYIYIYFFFFLYTCTGVTTMGKRGGGTWPSLLSCFSTVLCFGLHLLLCCGPLTCFLLAACPPPPPYTCILISFLRGSWFTLNLEITTLMFYCVATNKQKQIYHRIMTVMFP